MQHCAPAVARPIRGHLLIRALAVNEHLAVELGELAMEEVLGVRRCVLRDSARLTEQSLAVQGLVDRCPVTGALTMVFRFCMMPCVNRRTPNIAFVASAN